MFACDVQFISFNSTLMLCSFKGMSVVELPSFVKKDSMNFIDSCRPDVIALVIIIKKNTRSFEANVFVKHR
jgi:hypothetical protein